MKFIETVRKRSYLWNNNVIELFHEHCDDFLEIDLEQKRPGVLKHCQNALGRAVLFSFLRLKSKLLSGIADQTFDMDTISLVVSGFILDNPNLINIKPIPLKKRIMFIDA